MTDNRPPKFVPIKSPDEAVIFPHVYFADVMGNQFAHGVGFLTVIKNEKDQISIVLALSTEPTPEGTSQLFIPLSPNDFAKLKAALKAPIAVRDEDLHS